MSSYHLSVISFQCFLSYLTIISSCCLTKFKRVAAEAKVSIVACAEDFCRQYTYIPGRIQALDRRLTGEDIIVGRQFQKREKLSFYV